MKFTVIMNKQRLSFLLLFLICLFSVLGWSTRVQAASVKNLYQFKIPVEDRSNAVRNQALKKAFSSVLVKVTGNPAVLMQDEVAKALKKPERYIARYQYQKEFVEPTLQALDAPPVTVLSLVILFDKGSVEELLQKSAVLTWDADRPLTLLWIAVDDGLNGRQIVPDHSENNIVQAIQSAFSDEAESVGLPILFPLMDLTDRAQVNMSDVWGLFPDPLLRISQRYHNDHLLMGRIYRGDDVLWHAHWLLLVGSEKITWEEQKENLTELTQKATERLLAELSQRFAGIEVKPASVPMTFSVTDVNSLEDYAKVLSYFRQLVSVVSDVQIAGRERNTLTLSAKVTGGEAALRTVLARDHMVKVIENDDPKFTGPLQFQLISDGG